MEEFEQKVAALTLVPSRGGVFEVTVDGDLIYSKNATGRHPSYEEVSAAIRSRA